MLDKTNLFVIDDSIQSKYSIFVNVPKYLPKAECPKLYECFSTKKYDELINEIKNSSVSEEEKQFLMLAATRHLVFTYSKIADYYAHASKEMQELMEHNALVIIDFDDALANGYIELTDRIHTIAKQSKVYKDRLEKYNMLEDSLDGQG